ncbi:hypothetical protein CspeluHIS016_0203220 [Cutaneotrichosporon spelunceum]|uniref:Gfd2/YDR514C-like C-terminal domain-containing protein n=1 Tax=Cutaneotrichosporon spelunceum TaxID=1672016 RepID=A0AAD3Y9U7_9TREE|nr:hypothetical protein CspeluHIS016_0203220 [Cutaneotrichosporon spelunceum]
MGDNTRYGNPAEFETDLHSIYAAYLGDFDSQNIDWWDASWGGYFRSFSDFLGFGWEAMVIVDSATGRAHIAARREQIALFARMIKTRFGETLDKEPPSIMPLDPAPARSRTLHRIINITDLEGYKKLSRSLAPAELSHVRARVRAGEPGVVTALFNSGAEDDVSAASAGVRTNGQGYTWACIKTTWWEKGGPPQGYVPGHGRTVMARPGKGGKGLMLEVGLAALRCANLRAVDVWPPIPDKNYRKAHYVMEEWVDKRTNTAPPNFPRAYGFGRSQFTSEKSVERIVEASLGGLASHDTDGGPNTLILLSIGEPQPIPLPHATTFPQNVLQLDVLQLEFALLQQAQRLGVPGVGDRTHPLQSLRQLLHHLQIPVAGHAPLGNAGNEAFYTVLAFQKLLMRDTRLPDQLFQQAAFATGYPQGDYYMHPGMAGAMGGPMGATMMAPQYTGAQFAQFGGLPMPPPIRADGGPRRGSSSSLNRISLPALDSEPPSFPAPLSRQATGESGYGGSNRPQTIAINSPAGMNLPLDGRDETPRVSNGSRSSTMPRSQTVYWDNAEYSSGEGRSRQRVPGSGERRGGSGHPPPSSLRHSQMVPNATGMSTNSRSVSFHEDRRPATVHSAGSSSGSFVNSRSNSGTAIGPSGLSNIHANSGLSSASASASSGPSASDGSLSKQRDENGKDKENKMRKTKSGHSVKQLGSALQKFWVD